MKRFWMRVTSWLLIVIMLGMAPQQAMPEVEAAGVVPVGLAAAYAGDRLRITVPGEYVNMYQTTNFIFSTNENTIAHIWAYDNTYAYGNSDEENAKALLYDEYVCSGSFSDTVYNFYAGYIIFIEVQYGHILVTYNTANHDGVPSVDEGGCDKLDWLVQGTISEGYMTVGEDAKFGIASTQSGYDAAVYINGYSSSDNNVASVYQGTIHAKSPGTAVITMQYRFGTSDTQYFNEYLTCIVNVVEDYSVTAASDSYYAEGNDKYFNIVAYDKNDKRVNGFNITVGDDVYQTSDTYEMLVTLPEGYTDSVLITKDGYIPYELKNEYITSSNTIMMYPKTDGEPTIMSVWVRDTTESNYRNVRLETLAITEGSSDKYVISYDADWAGDYATSLYLSQGNIQVPISSTQSTVSLGEYFTAAGGTIYLCGYTINGYQIKVPLRIMIQAEVEYIDLDFGDSVSETISEEIQVVGGKKLEFDLSSTVPVSFVINSDGSVKGTIGIRYKTKAKEEDIYSISEEISNAEKQIDAAKKNGDKTKARTLTRNLENKLKKKEKNYLESKKKSFGVDGSVTFMGCFEGRMNNGNLEVTDLSLVTDVTVEAIYTKYFYVGYLPFQWKTIIKEQLECVFGGVSGSSGEIDVKIPDFTSTTSITGTLSTGVFDAFEICATANGKLKYDFAEQSRDLSDSTWTLDVEITSGPKLLDLDGSEWTHWDAIDDYQIYPKESVTALSAAYEDSVYLANEEVVEEAGNTTAQTIKSGTYVNSQPQLVNLDGTDMLVWVDADTTRDTANQMCLYYALYSDGAWSEAAAVWNDGYADAMPVLTVLDGTAYLVWQKANELFDGTTEYTDRVTAYEIYMASYDSEAGIWSEPVCVHETNKLMDTAPQIQIIGDVLSIVWVQIENVTDETSDSVIMKSVYDSETGWTEEVLCIVDAGVTGLAYGSEGAVYYAAADDVYSLVNGEVTLLSSSETADSNPKIYNNTLYWMSDDTITDGIVSIPVETAYSDYAVYTLDEDGYTAIVYYGIDDAGQQLYATYGNGTVWGEPIALTSKENVMYSGVTGYCDSEQQLRLALNYYENQQADLRITTVEKAADLQTVSMDYLGTTLQSDGTLVADVLVKNTGTTFIGTVSTNLNDGDTRIANISSEIDLYPGQDTYVKLSIPVNSLTTAEKTVAVEPIYQKDSDSADNTLSVEIPLTDLSVENATAQMNGDGTTHISAMLINRGLEDISGISVSLVKDASDGTLLDTIELTETLAVGTTTFVSFDTDGLAAGDMAYIVAALDTSENYDSNNEAYVLIDEMLRDESEIELEPDISEEEIELGAEYSFSVSEEEATCLFTPEEDGFYIIYLEGMMSDVGDAEPYVTAYVDDVGIGYTNQSVDNIENNTWQYDYYGYVELEAGKTYTLAVEGTQGAICTMRVEKAPLPESVSFADKGIWEGYNEYVVDAVTEPEMSIDEWEFTSSDPTVSGVSTHYSSTNLLYGLNPGMVTITAKGKYSGIQTSFSVTVEKAADNRGEVNEGTAINVSPDEDNTGIYYFTPEEGGYYTIFEGGSFDIWDEQSTEYERLQGGAVVYLQKDIRYTVNVYSGTLCFQKLKPVTIPELYDYQECDGVSSECGGVALYEYTPTEAMVAVVGCKGYYCDYIKLYDENFQLISEVEGEGYRNYLYSILEKDKTYYIAIEHVHGDSMEMWIGQVTMNIYGPCYGFVGETGEYSYSMTSDEEVTWNSSDTKVAVVDENGLVTYLKEGVVTITASAYDGLVMESCTVSVLATQTLELNEPVSVSFDYDSYGYAKMEFIPETSGKYYFIMQTEGDYYMYDAYVQDADGNYIDYEWVSQDYGAYLACTLEAGKTYAFLFEYMAYTEDDNFTLTATITDSDGVTVPPAVTAKVTMASATSATVSWTASEGADGYTIWQSTSKSGTYTAVTSVDAGTLKYTNKSLVYGETYYYKVTAYRQSVWGEKHSKDSDIVSVTLKLSTPTLSSVANTSTGVKVTWTKVTGASGYYVYRKTTSGSWSKVGTVKSGSTLTYTDTSAKAGTTYKYTVKAYYSSNVSAYNTTGLTIRRLTNPVVTLTNTSSGVKVSWKKITGASGYYVYRKTSSGSYSKIKTISSGSTVSYTDTSSKNGTKYTYKVVARYSSYTSSYSAKSTVRLMSPTISSAKNSAAKSIVVKWNKNTEATGYQIKYVTGSTSKTITVSKYSTVSYTIKKLTKGETYKVYVRSYKTVSGTKYYSAWSAYKSVKVSK